MDRTYKNETYPFINETEGVQITINVGCIAVADAEFRKTGLERSEKVGKDLEWFGEQGHAIPQPSNHGIDYASYLNDLSEKDPHAFICHFYMTYFGHTAGGRIIGKKVNQFI